MPPLHGLAALLLVASAGALATDAPPAAKPSVEQLIEQLGDSSFPVRSAAAKEIEALGPAALPALRKAQNHKDAEVRRRITGWIPSLERAAQLEPKYVSFRLTDRPLREAINAIAKQTGYKLELSQDPARDKLLYSFAFEHVPFWDVLDKIGEQTGVTAQPNYGDETVRLYYQDRYSPYVCRRGAFRMVAQGLNYGRSIQFFSLPRVPAGEQSFSENLNFTFQIFSEPRLPLMSAGEATVTEATDDQKRSLVPPKPANQPTFGRHVYYGGGHRMYQLHAQANLTPSTRDAKLIKVLKGTIPLTLLVDQKALVVTDKVLMAKGKKFTVGTVTFDVQDVRETPDKRYEVKMAITNGVPNAAADYTWLNSLYGRVELHDDQGKKFPVSGSSIGMNGATAQVTFTYGHVNAGLGKPVKLVYNDWTTAQHDVAFEFRDLPLP